MDTWGRKSIDWGCHPSRMFPPDRGTWDRSFTASYAFFFCFLISRLLCFVRFTQYPGVCLLFRLRWRPTHRLKTREVSLNETRRTGIFKRPPTFLSLNFKEVSKCVSTEWSFNSYGRTFRINFANLLDFWNSFPLLVDSSHFGCSSYHHQLQEILKLLESEHYNISYNHWTAKVMILLLW